MLIVLFDDLSRSNLLPLTFTRPVAALRVGILTIAEKWEKYLTSNSTSYLTEFYLEEKFPCLIGNKNIFINGSILPDIELIEIIKNLKEEEALYHQNILIAANLPELSAKKFNWAKFDPKKTIQYKNIIHKISFPEDLFKFNDSEIKKDYQLLTQGRISQKLSNTNQLLGDNIFVEKGVLAECSTFNSLNGPIYLGKNSEIWEGAHIRGSFALCEHSQIKMGAKIYGMTTIGPHSKIGGEINNVVIQGYSSKSHDGYLGHSALGEWCNLGADTNTSNMKNTYSKVKLWDYNQMHFRNTNLQFCGLIMGDHSKCSINTMFNTGTVIGVGVNIFGIGFPNKFVPDFSWEVYKNLKHIH